MQLGCLCLSHLEITERDLVFSQLLKRLAWVDQYPATFKLLIDNFKKSVLEDFSSMPSIQVSWFSFLQAVTEPILVYLLQTLTLACLWVDLYRLKNRVKTLAASNFLCFSQFFSSFGRTCRILTRFNYKLKGIHESS